VRVSEKGADTPIVVLTLDYSIRGKFLYEAPLLIRVEIEVKSIYGRDKKKQRGKQRPSIQAQHEERRTRKGRCDASVHPVLIVGILPLHHHHLDAQLEQIRVQSNKK